MVNDTVLRPSVELLLQDTTTSKESIIALCVRLFKKHGFKLITTIFDVLKANMPKNANKCPPLFDLLKAVTELEDFEEEYYPKLAKLIFELYHQDFSTPENPCIKPAISVLLPLIKKAPQQIYPLFNNLFAPTEQINYFYLLFFYRAISLRDPSTKEYMCEILDLLLAKFQTKDEETNENRELFLDIFLASFQVIDTKNIPSAFNAIYNAVFDTCLEDEKLRSKAFKFLSAAVATISSSEAATKLEKNSQKFIKFLNEPATKHYTATCLAALMTRAQDVDTHSTVQTLQAFCDPLLNYVRSSYKSFVDQTDDMDVMRGIPESIRCLQVIRQKTGSKIIESCTQKFADEANLYVLSSLSFNPNERDIISKNLLGLMTVPHLSQNARLLALELFAKLVEENADIRGLSPHIVRICSSSKQIIPDFERQILSSVSSNTVFQGMLDTIFDPRYILAVRTCFAAMRQSSVESMKTSLGKDQIIEDQWFFASVQCFHQDQSQIFSLLLVQRFLT